MSAFKALLADGRNTWAPSLSDPTTILLPMVMQVFPKGWQPEQPQCRVIVGNWLGGTADQFMTDNNVKLVAKASGSRRGTLKPPHYGSNGHIGGQPEVAELPINSKKLAQERWEAVSLKCIAVFNSNTANAPPASVFGHCNEGINRAPALASLLVGKLHDSDPADEVAILAQCSEVNPMNSDVGPK